MPDMTDILLADFRPAQNSHQGHQETMGWPRTTQSLGACALQPSFQAAIPTQQPLPKVGTCQVYQRSRIHLQRILVYSRICQTCRPLQPSLSRRNPPLRCPSKTLSPLIPPL